MTPAQFEYSYQTFLKMFKNGQLPYKQPSRTDYRTFLGMMGLGRHTPLDDARVFAGRVYLEYLAIMNGMRGPQDDTEEPAE